MIKPFLWGQIVKICKNVKTTIKMPIFGVKMVSYPHESGVKVNIFLNTPIFIPINTNIGFARLK